MSGFNRRIESQQICLERYFIHHVNDLGYFVTGIVNIGYRNDHLVHRFKPLTSTGLGHGKTLGGVGRKLCIALAAFEDLMHGNRRFLNG